MKDGSKNDFEHFRDWLPARLFWQDSRVFVDWCYVGKERLTEPFFDDSIIRRHREPFNLLFRHQTPLEFLGELANYSNGLKPSGFIFHLSRCGSTLVSQMLSKLDQNIVISEASPLDFVLRSKNESKNVSQKERIRWLQWTINAFGQMRNDKEKHFFIKFDSWNTLDLTVIKAAFPDVPWIFLYRNPVEIIVSHRRQPGAQTIAGLINEILPGLNLKKALKMPPEEYCARVLERICQTVLDFLPDRKSLLVNYSQLPAATTSIISEHFRVIYRPEEIAQMKFAAQFNAKTPQLNFTGDSELKQQQATESAVRAAEKFVDPVYRQLEKLRLENSLKGANL